MNPQFIEMLAKAMDTGKDDDEKSPKWNNPAKYPRHARVADAEALRLIDETNAYMERLRKMEREARIIAAKMTAANEELFSRLEELHPGVRKGFGGGGTGYRQWQDEWYFVGWDDPKRAAEAADADGTARVPGNYL